MDPDTATRSPQRPGAVRGSPAASPGRVHCAALSRLEERAADRGAACGRPSAALPADRRREPPRSQRSYATSSRSARSGLDRLRAGRGATHERAPGTTPALRALSAGLPPPLRARRCVRCSTESPPASACARGPPARGNRRPPASVSRPRAPAWSRLSALRASIERRSWPAGSPLRRARFGFYKTTEDAPVRGRGHAHRFARRHVPRRSRCSPSWPRPPSCWALCR